MKQDRWINQSIESERIEHRAYRTCTFKYPATVGTRARLCMISATRNWTTCVGHAGRGRRILAAERQSLREKIEEGL